MIEESQSVVKFIYHVCAKLRIFHLFTAVVYCQESWLNINIKKSYQYEQVLRNFINTETSINSVEWNVDSFKFLAANKFLNAFILLKIVLIFSQEKYWFSKLFSRKVKVQYTNKDKFNISSYSRIIYKTVKYIFRKIYINVKLWNFFF